MLPLFDVLDRLLRGESTHPASITKGQLPIPVLGLTTVIVLLGLLHGFCVGWYALFNHQDPTVAQLAATTLKVPALFLLTLAVTFPSLYVFNALVGSRLRFAALFGLMVATIAVSLAVLASFGPIVAFFSVSTTNYPFMVLLNVVAFGAAGGLGLKFLHQTLTRMSAFTTPADLPADPEDLGALDRAESSVLGPHVRVVFAIWMAVFALVGSQMGWVLRPFIGRPDAPFTWLREREGSFFGAVVSSLCALLS